MKIIVLLGGGIEGLPIIQRARNMGLRVVVVDGDPQAIGMRLAYEDRTVASCYDPVATVAALHQMGLRYNGALSCATDTPHVAAAVAHAFGLPGLMPKAAALSVDKHSQKTRLIVAHIPVPVFGYAEGPEDLLSNMVVKPADSRGARGVTRILPSIDPKWAYEQAIIWSPAGRVMVEEWLDGPQLSTESIILGGEPVFTAVSLRNYARLDEFAPYVIEDGFDMPADLAALGVNLYDLNALLGRAVKALGWNIEPGLTVKGDLVVHEGKPHILELAARLSGGFHATHGIPNAYGLDFISSAISLALGESPPENTDRPTGGLYVSQRYVFPNRDDIGKRVKRVTMPALDFPAESGTVKHATYAIRAGDIIRPVTDHSCRLGQAMAVALSPQDALAAAAAAVAQMKQNVEL